MSLHNRLYGFALSARGGGSAHTSECVRACECVCARVCVSTGTSVVGRRFYRAIPAGRDYFAQFITVSDVLQWNYFITVGELLQWKTRLYCSIPALSDTGYRRCLPSGAPPGPGQDIRATFRAPTSRHEERQPDTEPDFRNE